MDINLRIVRKKRAVIFAQLLGLVFFAFCTILAQGQAFTYDVYKGKRNHIGTLSMSQVDSMGHTVIVSETDVTFSVIFDFNLRYHFHTVYENGVLKTAQTESYLNESKRDFSTIKRKGGVYSGVVDGQAIDIPDSAIHYAISSLYFDEPKHLEKAFSERFGEWCQIERMSPNSYRLHLPNGKSNVYHYNQEGVCHLVEVSTTLANLVFELQK